MSRRTFPSCELQLLCAIACVAVLIVACNAFAIDPAAVVMVQDAPNAKGEMNTGAGTVIALSDAKTPVATILTCAHVSESGQPLTVDYRQDGFRIKAETVTIDRVKDYAILRAYVPRGWTAKIPLGSEYPKPGDTLDLYGFPWTAQGKMVRKQLGFVGFCTDGFHYNWLSLQPGCISGDSGGPIVYKGTVIGVCSGAVLHPETKQEVNSHGPWVGLIDKKYTSDCCGGPQQQPVGGGFIGVGIGRLRVPSPPRQVQQPAQPLRDPALQAWLTEVRDQLVQVNQRLDGIKSCECGEQTTVTAEDVAAVLINKYPDKVRGPKGDRGLPGTDGSEPEPASADQRHFVVVGDPSARYAKKLASDVEKTKNYFDAIELVAPPENKNVGTLPALVLYVGSQEAVTYRGTGDVYLQLSRIRRGEFN